MAATMIEWIPLRKIYIAYDRNRNSLGSFTSLAAARSQKRCSRVLVCREFVGKGWRNWHTFRREVIREVAA